MYGADRYSMNYVCSCSVTYPDDTPSLCLSFRLFVRRSVFTVAAIYNLLLAHRGKHEQQPFTGHRHAALARTIRVNRDSPCSATVPDAARPASEPATNASASQAHVASRRAAMAHFTPKRAAALCGRRRRATNTMPRVVLLVEAGSGGPVYGPAAMRRGDIRSASAASCIICSY